jgi:Ser/Thr protein kinase RdoA (MazF antagonist)
MSGAGRRPPSVSFEAALRILRGTFHFEDVLQSSFTELPCYDDRHFYFEGRLISTAQRRDTDDGTAGKFERFVLRISNLMFPAGLVEGLNALMLHLSSRGINCSRPIASRVGRYMEMIPGKKISQAGHYPQEYPVRVLRFVSGTLMSELDAECLTPTFLYSVGRFAGRVDAALQDFSHPAIEDFVNECWDLQHFSCLKKYISSLSEKKKITMANSVMKLYEEKIEPMLPSMKKGVIHGDLNGKNIIVQQSENSAAIVGLIDFGDCVHSYYLFELAILVAHTMMSHDHRIELVAPVIKGYIDVFPLTQEELQCLYYAVLAILCTTGVKGEHVYATEPENMHMQHYIPRAWKLLSQLLPMSKDSVEASWNVTYHC